MSEAGGAAAPARKTAVWGLAGLSTAFVAWLAWPSAETPRPDGVVVVRAASAASAAPPPGPFAAASPAAPLVADRTMPRDASNGRIDPPLDRLVAAAQEDVRTMHDQIAQQDKKAADSRREAMVAAALGQVAGLAPRRIICAGAICEVAGDLIDARALADPVVADRLAAADLSLGPSAYAEPGRDGRMLFVQYVNVEGDPGA